jgi:hypothetical protein
MWRLQKEPQISNSNFRNEVDFLYESTKIFIMYDVTGGSLRFKLFIEVYVGHLDINIGGYF